MQKFSPLILRLNKTCFIFAITLVLAPFFVGAEEGGGSLRGNVYDKDFDAPLAGAQITIAETGQEIQATEDGNFVFDQVYPGTYTIVFAKEGYTRQVQPNIIINAGQLTEVNASLAGEFTEMDEFVVQDIQLASGKETELLKLRVESTALLDSISADLMSQAGASDAAAALNLVSGATVQDGKYAVVRGLPDRYVSSQMNGVRLPTADPDKRAVQLDQFPSEVIENIQISKTFTPDQQGDASGGAVNLLLKGIPEETVLNMKTAASYNSQVAFGDEFLTNEGGGVNFLGWDDDQREIPIFNGPLNDIQDHDSVGVLRDGDAPNEYEFSLTAGKKIELPFGIKTGGFSNVYYKRDTNYYDDGVNDTYWIDKKGGDLIPRPDQGTPGLGSFKTQLFDVTQGTEEVQWGVLNSVGVELENHSATMTYMYTRTAEDKATLLEDTRGKSYFFPGYDPNDPTSPGYDSPDAAPYLRTETVAYTERTTQTWQWHGEHAFPIIPEIGLDGFLSTLPPEMDWTIAFSSSGLYQPDKKQFGSLFKPPTAPQCFPGFGCFGGSPPVHEPYQPAESINVGNFQRVWKDIDEDSDQFFINWKLPFEQWTGDKGEFKFGMFRDKVKRNYNQDSFSNDIIGLSHQGAWDESWSQLFQYQDHPVTPEEIDVDYVGRQRINAFYYMGDFPVWSFVRVIGGVRFEDTKLEIINDPEEDVDYVNLKDPAAPLVDLNPGDADVSTYDADLLPALSLVLGPIKNVTIRGSYTETIARQTFKELTPIQQQEFLGADVFVGNPFLNKSTLINRDLRVDYTPFEGGLISYTYFIKDIKDPIEYVQKRNPSFSFTTPINYTKGQLNGHEIEVRQQMGEFFGFMKGLTIGSNATLIDSEVILPQEEAELFFPDVPLRDVPLVKRDMTNAPSYLYNLFFTYDIERIGAEVGLFWTMRGNTLIAGADGAFDGVFIPNVYEAAYGTLNLSISKKFGNLGRLSFKAKNLLNPNIQTVYRSPFHSGDTVKTSYQKGVDYTLGYSIGW